MGMILSAALCCTSCACSAASCCCMAGRGANAMGRQAAKGSYVALLGAGTLLAWAGQRFFEDQSFEIGELDFICDGSDGDNICSDDGFVLRVSFMMTMFFLLMLLCTLPFPTLTGERRFGPILGDGFQSSCWAVKILLFMALMGMTVLLPSSTFDVQDNSYAVAARVVSSLFLILQVLMLIDFGFQWNEDWVTRGFDGGDVAVNKGWLFGVIFFAVLFNVMAIGGLIFIFLKYDECTEGKPFVIVTLIAYLIYTIPLTLFREQLIGEPGAVLPASVVGLYTVFLVWSAIESLPEPGCRPFDDGSDMVVFVGIAFATVTLVWTSYTASRRSQNLLRGDQSAEPTADNSQLGGLYAVDSDDKGRDVLARDQNRDAEAQADVEDSNNPNDRYDDKPWLFHVFMVTGAMYSAMLLTNWGVEDAGADGINNEAIGRTSFWVKLISQWLCIVLFIWVLIAPRVLQGRDFA